MNKLIVGADKRPILQSLPNRFLIIDDGELIDELDLPPRRSIVDFDFEKHSFNPLKDISYLKAREFLDVLNAIFPEGDSTLTKRNSNFVLLNALLDKPQKLDRLISDSKDTRDAYQKIQTLLLSPVLKNVLNHPTNFSFKGTIVARLDRAVLGDFDAFVLGNLLISQYAGTVVIPDFGFYAIPAHTSLIRQNRLIAGVTAFDEVPTMRSQLLQIEDKLGSRATPDDAAILAQYAGISPTARAYREFIEDCIRPA